MKVSEISKFLVEGKSGAGPPDAVKLAALRIRSFPARTSSGYAGAQPLRCESGRLIIDLPALMLCESHMCRMGSQALPIITITKITRITKSAFKSPSLMLRE